MGRHLTGRGKRSTSIKLKKPNFNMVTEEKLDNYFSVLGGSSDEPIILDIEEESLVGDSRSANNVNVYTPRETSQDRLAVPTQPFKIPDENMPTVFFAEEPSQGDRRAPHVNEVEEARRRRERMMLKLSEAKLHGLMNNILYN